MRNVLVTGGAGFIGANFVHYWRQRHPEDHVTILDALTYAGHRENLDGALGSDCELVEGDICDAALVARLFRERGVDTVVHFAAESHVDRSITGPDAFIQTNVVGTHTLLAAALAAWKDGRADRRFHHVSTDEVYGSLNPEDAAFHEGTPYAPNSPYAASKAASDHLVRAYHHTFGLPVTISNCSNNYGPLQFPEKLIPVVIGKALAGEPLPIYGDGLNVRDWLHVHDHCAAIDCILERGAIGRTYNIGGASEVSNLTLVEKVCAYIDELVPDSPYRPHRDLQTFVTDRAGHDRRYAIDFSRIRKELGWRPEYPLDVGLRETVSWYLSNKRWMESVLAPAAVEAG